MSVSIVAFYLVFVRRQALTYKRGSLRNGPGTVLRRKYIVNSKYQPILTIYDYKSRMLKACLSCTQTGVVRKAGDTPSIFVAHALNFLNKEGPHWSKSNLVTFQLTMGRLGEKHKS